MTPAKRNILAWAYGLAAAFIQGGAAALAATVTASLIDPEKFNLGQQLRNFLEMAVVTFVVSGVLGAAGYLKQSPLPPMVEKTTDQTESDAGRADPTDQDDRVDRGNTGLAVVLLLCSALALGGCASFDRAYRASTQEDDISVQGGYDIETKDANGQIVWRHVYREPGPGGRSETDWRKDTSK